MTYLQASKNDFFSSGKFWNQSVMINYRFNFFQLIRANVCAQWRILKLPGSLLATDSSKAVVLVIFGNIGFSIGQSENSGFFRSYCSQ